MRTEIFAIKLTKEEKDALDFVSSRARVPKSRLIYPVVHQRIEKLLGIALIYALGYRTKKDLDEMKNAMVHMETPKTSHAVTVLIDVLSQERIWKDYMEIFNDLIGNEEFHRDFIEMVIMENIDDIYTHIGRKYLSSSGSFENIDLDFVRHLFIEKTLEIITYNISQRPYKETEHTYRMKRAKIVRFISHVEKTYANIMRKSPVEAIEVRGRGRRTGKKDKKSTKR